MGQPRDWQPLGLEGHRDKTQKQAPSTGARNVAGSYGVEAMAAERSGAVKETQPLLEHALHGREGEKSLLLPVSCPPSTCHRFPLAGPGRKRAGERDGKGLAGGGEDPAENRPPPPSSSASVLPLGCLPPASLAQVTLHRASVLCWEERCSVEFPMTLGNALWWTHPKVAPGIRLSPWVWAEHVTDL